MLIINDTMDLAQLAARMSESKGGWRTWKITEADAIRARDILLERNRAGQDFDSFSVEEWQEIVGDAVVRALRIELPMTAWAAVLSGLNSAKRDLIDDSEWLQLAAEEISDALSTLELRP